MLSEYHEDHEECAELLTKIVADTLKQRVDLQEESQNMLLNNMNEADSAAIAHRKQNLVPLNLSFDDKDFFVSYYHQAQSEVLIIYMYIMRRARRKTNFTATFQTPCTNNQLHTKHLIL